MRLRSNSNKDPTKLLDSATQFHEISSNRFLLRFCSKIGTTHCICNIIDGRNLQPFSSQYGDGGQEGNGRGASWEKIVEFHSSGHFRSFLSLDFK